MKCVLIADDLREKRALCVTSLALAGFVVAEAADGSQVIDVVVDHCPRRDCPRSRDAAAAGMTPGIDDRLWHPWLRIERLIRTILETRWDNRMFPVAKVLLTRALEERLKIWRAGWN